MNPRPMASRGFAVAVEAISTQTVPVGVVWGSPDGTESELTREETARIVRIEEANQARRRRIDAQYPAMAPRKPRRESAPVVSWRRIVGRLVGLALLFGFLIWAYPYLRNLGRVVGLLREPPPAALPVPVEGVGRSQLTDTWGAMRSEGRSHEGIDIFAPRGTPIRSATRGVVVRKGWNRLGGKTVSVFGPAGWFHYYAHLEDWEAPTTGDWVEAGAVLGYVGDTGNAKGTPPHLHYGIYSSGQARNPYPLLVKQ